MVRVRHFTKISRVTHESLARGLCAQLREELGAKVMLARAVPAKWSLLGVNKKPELIEKRRKELEVQCIASTPAKISDNLAC